ncbi:uncharacterized protein LOC116425332 isoform X1 [Nomia melanderi]|uniref:uncharacterized protein LOC116425332 isoform X1 n=1 Tax=Nomia melanderi TaxID=2448451 RepID=UPI003FCDAB23
MTKINTCEIFNEIDKKYYTLYIEWFNSYFKVTLLEPTMLPLNGKMDTKEIQFFCEQLSKSFEEYFLETKKIFSGKNEDIQFLIEDTILKWKNNTWTLGRINLNLVSDVKIISESFQQSLKFYQGVQEELNILKEENKSLVHINIKLKSDLDKMIEVKTGMEQDMFKKFSLILNSKKRKLWEIHNILKKKEDTKASAFHVSTDESEESDEGNYRKSKIKKISNDNSVHIQKIAIDEEISQKPSTSRDCMKKNTKVKKNDTEQKDEMQREKNCIPEARKSRSSLNFIEESEDELFS